MIDNYFEKNEGFDVNNIYSDLYVNKNDVLTKDSIKISTINKPYIWRNHVFNLPTNTKLEHSNSKYSIGIEVIYCTCLPISLFSILSKKEFYTNFGYKIRSYRDIRSSSFVNDNLITKSNLDDNEDIINKVVNYNKDKVKPIFIESMSYGYNNKGEQHTIRGFYFKDLQKVNNFMFIFETEIKSDATEKTVLRNMGFNIFSIKNPSIDEVSTRQLLTIKQRGMFVGDYENNYLKIEPESDEEIDILYE